MSSSSRSGRRRSFESERKRLAKQAVSVQGRSAGQRKTSVDASARAIAHDAGRPAGSVTTRAAEAGPGARGRITETTKEARAATRTRGTGRPGAIRGRDHLSVIDGPGTKRTTGGDRTAGREGTYQSDRTAVAPRRSSISWMSRGNRVEISPSANLIRRRSLHHKRSAVARFTILSKAVQRSSNNLRSHAPVRPQISLMVSK